MQPQTVDNSARYLLQTSATRAHSVGSFGDVEFVDPAILEVGQGRQPAWISDPGRDMRPYSSVQHSPNFDSGLQQLMRQSDHQNLTLSRSENQSISPMPLGHYQPSFHSAVTQFTAEPFRNIHMQNEGWYLRNDVKVDLGVSDLVSRQGMGLNNFRPSYEELRSPMSSSSNVYNRGFAI
jgi:CCR4-NOT transcription complex subunit 4